MERLTRRDLADVNGKQIVLCDSKEEDCNDSCLYRRCKWNEKALQKLKEYEEAEEQGLLLRLPCRVGDTIYRINQYAKEPIISMKVLQIHYGELSRGNTFFRVDAINDEDMGESCYFKDDFGKKVFLTKEEAEAALVRMEGDS